MPTLSLRRWQTIALERWTESRNRGIVSVVTGGGKTIFALACIDTLKPFTTLIVVPTAALLDQWWEESAAFFGLPLEEINIVTANRRVRAGTINISVINTASELAAKGKLPPCFLIVDECHKAASEAFRKVFNIETIASLGLSATPERQYDDGLNQILIPSLGPVIYEYGYPEAKRDGVIVPFVLKNVVFELEDERQAQYDKLTKAIAKSIATEGIEARRSISLLLKRARLLNLSERRIVLALRLVAANRGKRALVFHEDIEACEAIAHVLKAHEVPSGVYHSRLPLKVRAQMLSDYRTGKIQVLVTCRALDEGFNVPETELGIIAASTATRRQRIQRLGRILRPASNKSNAIVYTLVATGPEIQRLKDEEQELDGIAEVTWGRA